MPDAEEMAEGWENLALLEKHVIGGFNCWKARLACSGGRSVVSGCGFAFAAKACCSVSASAPGITPSLWW